MTVAGAVLAAGRGSRFEGSEHKLLAPFRGRPVVWWAVQAARGAGLDALYVITGAVDLTGALAGIGSPSGGPVLDRDGTGPTVALVANPRWAEGQATSVGVALDRAAADGHEAVVIGLGDQPMIPASAWSAVAAADTPIAVAGFDGVRRPPVRLHRKVWAQIPRTGDEGARRWWRERPELVSEIPCSGNPIDIDTLEDLRRWN
ncbi:MAG: NTP transferase domain-containing protein [Acidimicrobiales bacterium]